MNDGCGRYFEDFKPGERFQTAPLLVSEALIVEFGRFYDPQPFHLDPQAAKETIYGGLIASGLQTIALTFKLFLESGALTPSSLGIARDSTRSAGRRPSVPAIRSTSSPRCWKFAPRPRNRTGASSACSTRP